MSKIFWNKQQDKVLIDCYSVQDSKSLSLVLFKSEDQLRRRAHYLGLSKTPDYIESIRRKNSTKNRVCKLCTKKHFGLDFCRNHYALYNRGTIDRNGLGKINVPNVWTERETNLLKELYPSSTIDELLIVFPTRVPSSIRNKAKRLSLKKTDSTVKKCHKTKMKEESKIKMSCSLRGIKREDFDGFVTNINFRVRQTDKYKIWRLLVFNRDGFKCQKCGIGVSGNLNAHHIKFLKHLILEYPDKEVDINNDYFYEIDNGKTLCESCHVKIHFKK